MDPELKTKIEIHKRNCRFSDEIPQNMTMFNKYSASACKFDCMMRYRYLVYKYYNTDFPIWKGLVQKAL